MLTDETPVVLNKTFTDFLIQFPFIASETAQCYYQQKVNVRVASRVAKQLKTLNLQKLGDFKKWRKRSDYEHPASHSKVTF